MAKTGLPELVPGVFLDRDGTVIVEKHFLHRPEDVELLPTVGETIARLNSLRIPVAIVTNQAGIARGYFAESCIPEVHARLDELLAKFGARVDAYQYCPHHPTEGLGEYKTDCECRKPRPGMLLASARTLGIDIPRSLMVGDRMGDLQAGLNAGCKAGLVRTGYGGSVTLESSTPGILGGFSTLRELVEVWLCESRL